MPSGKIPTLTMKPTWSCARIAYEKCPSKPRTINHGKLRNYQLTLACLNCKYPVLAKHLVKKVGHVAFVLITLVNVSARNLVVKGGVTSRTCVVQLFIKYNSIVSEGKRQRVRMRGLTQSLETVLVFFRTTMIQRIN